MKNLKTPTSSDNLSKNFDDFIFNLNEEYNEECFDDLNVNSENLNYNSDFKEKFNKKFESLTKEQRIEFLCQLQKEADLLAKKYGLSTLKIGGNA